MASRPPTALKLEGQAQCNRGYTSAEKSVPCRQCTVPSLPRKSTSFMPSTSTPTGLVPTFSEMPAPPHTK